MSPPRLGAILALATLALDQASKLYLLFGYDLPVREPVVLAPFLELIVVCNRGISYGLFQQDSELGRWALLAVMIGAAFGLSVWMARATSRLLGAKASTALRHVSTTEAPESTITTVPRPLRASSRRSPSTRAVMSVVATNTPATAPDSSRIGLYEKVQ